MNKEKTQNRINKILNNEFNVDDAQLLFYEIRESCTNKFVREIGDFIHPERNQGLTHSLLKQTATSVVKTFREGGVLNIAALTNYDQLVFELNAELERQGYIVDFKKLSEVKDKICVSIINFLDAKIIKIDIPEILECKLVKQGIMGTTLLVGLFTPKNDIFGVVKWNKNVSIAVPIINKI